MAAARGGVVAEAGTNGGFGQTVLIDHGDGVATRYAHLSAVKVGVGQEVNGGEQVGESGRSGTATAPVFFQVIIDGEPIDPLDVLP